jgi:hypothetical protein
MKGGLLSSGVSSRLRLDEVSWFSSLYGLLEEGPGRWENSGWSISVEGRRATSHYVGPCRSERFVFGEHVPDGLGELAGKFDAGDFFAALTNEAGSGALVMLGVEGMSGGVDRRFDERPAQIFGSVLGEWSSVVAFAGLIDAGTQPGVAGEFLG